MKRKEDLLERITSRELMSQDLDKIEHAKLEVLIDIRDILKAYLTDPFMASALDLEEE